MVVLYPANCSCTARRNRGGAAMRWNGSWVPPVPTTAIAPQSKNLPAIPWVDCAALDLVERDFHRGLANEPRFQDDSLVRQDEFGCFVADEATEQTNQTCEQENDADIAVERENGEAEEQKQTRRDEHDAAEVAAVQDLLVGQQITVDVAHQLPWVVARLVPLAARSCFIAATLAWHSVAAPSDSAWCRPGAEPDDHARQLTCCAE